MESISFPFGPTKEDVDSFAFAPKGEANDAEHQHVGEFQNGSKKRCLIQPSSNQVQDSTRIIEISKKHLQKLEKYLQVPSSVGIDRNTADCYGYERKDYKYGQREFANLLIRGSEGNVAVVVTRPHIAAQGGRAMIVRPPAIIVKATPRCPKLENGLDGTFCAEDLEPLDISQGVVRAVMKLYADRQGQIPFHRHAGISFGLLKRCYDERISQKRYTKRRREFKDYVYLACHEKMLARLKCGESPSNFLRILTAKEEEYLPGTFDRMDIPQDYRTILPTRNQAHFIRNYGKFFFQKCGLKQDEALAKADALADGFPYRISGRKFFHSMMTTIVETARIGLVELHEEVEAMKYHGWKCCEQCMKSIQKALGFAQGGMKNLDMFIRRFGKVTFGDTGVDLLSIHLSWLAGNARVQTRTDKPWFGGPWYSGQQNQGEDEVEGEQGDINAEVDFLIRDPKSKGMHKPGYASGVLKFLEIWCLYEKGFQKACPESMMHWHMGTVWNIRNGSVVVVDGG